VIVEAATLLVPLSPTIVSSPGFIHVPDLQTSWSECTRILEVCQMRPAGLSRLI
jgi:hypothetical protein